MGKGTGTGQGINTWSISPLLHICVSLFLISLSLCELCLASIPRALPMEGSSEAPLPFVLPAK